MTPDQSERIITTLAALGEATAGLRRDFDQERNDSHASRRELHEKVNGVVEDIATVRGDIKVSAEVTAQTRETVRGLKDAVEKAAPTIADVENAKKFGGMLLWFIGGGGLAALAAVLTWGEAFKAWLSHWLGIK